MPTSIITCALFRSESAACVLYTHAVAPQRVAMQVDHDPDRRILREISLHRGAAAAVGAGVARVVVDLTVVHDREPAASKRSVSASPTRITL